jgi:glutathione synthase/RimK-type ligase-like ATP-grasp enzyme
MRVALLTDRNHPSLTHDDRRLLPALTKAGFEVATAVWSDPAVEWAQFHAVILRSPWDYTDRFEEFSAWLDRIDRSGTRLVNPSAVVRWNLRKSYLDALGLRGVSVIPTARHLGVMGSLTTHLARWPRLVVKPEVSAAGRGTYRVDAQNVVEIDRILQTRPGDVFLVQPYLAGVETRGELSLVFFDRRYSHAIVKRAPIGGFLVHEEHGGTIRRAWPTDAVIAEARAILDCVEGPLPFARIDLIEDNDRVWLVEAELVEPELFLRFDRAATGRLVNAIASFLGSP